MSYTLDPKNLVFTDNEATRSVFSDEFNFVLDKDTGISACWGADINDTPEYDPMSPQEIVIKIGKNFDLEKYVSEFNLLGNIKIKVDETKFEDITDAMFSINNDNLVCLSTLGSVVLIVDSELNNIKINDLLTYTNYIRRFKVSVIIQINVKDQELTFEELTKLKLLGTSIQVKNDNSLNAAAFIKNLEQLEKNGILVSSKLTINDNMYDEAMKLMDLLPVNTSMKLIFVLPYITVMKYIKIQQKIIDNKLENIRIATCAHSRFNRRKQNNMLLHMNCDATTFSIYVEDGVIYPCEFSKSTGIKIDSCKSISDFWTKNKKINKFRQTIIDHNFCKLVNS